MKLRWLPVAAALLGIPACSPTNRIADPRPPGPAADTGAGTFVDITASCGLGSFERTDGGSGRKYFPEQMGSGAALFDFDQDGWLDVFFANGAPLPGFKGVSQGNRLFRNLGTGKFQDVTPKVGLAPGRYTIGAAAGDFDGDGRIDLYLTCLGPNVLLRNLGNGEFEDVTRRAGVGDPRLSSSAAWGDLDADGDLDLYVANYVKYDLTKDLFCSKFPGHKSFCGPTLYDPEVDSLFLNNGNGTFTDVSSRSGIRSRAANGLGVVWLDYDQDGRPDIFVANDQTPNMLWRNRGGGKFQDVAVETGVAFGGEGNARAGMGVGAGDFDNDGREDLVVTNFSEESNALYRNDGGTFRDVAMQSGMGASTLMYLGFGAGFLDYDRDGRQDLFFANGHVMDDIEMYSDSVTWAQPSQLFRNEGSGQFRETSRETTIGTGSRVARGAAFGDLDNDGRLDLVVSNMRGKPWVMANRTAPRAHWLGLDLRSKGANPFAIGASATLSVGPLKQMLVVRAGSSYASSHDTRLVFGLGTSSSITSVTVRWPNGQTTQHNNLAIDRYHRIESP